MNSPESNIEPLGQPCVVTGVAHPIGVRARLNALFLQVSQLAVLTLLALGFYYLISKYFLQSVRVVGSSMAPTLHDSESYLLNRWVYHVREPHRSDVVVLKDPADGGFSVKRVVAVRGDTVYMRDGILYVNGKQMREEYLQPTTLTFPDGKDFFRCGADEYFVLGDNRNNSVDSRRYGPVRRGNILGMIIR